MVEYSYDEALELLEANKATATDRLVRWLLLIPHTAKGLIRCLLDVQ